MSEGNEDELDLWFGEVVEEWVVVDFAFLEEEQPMLEVATLLGCCLSGDPSFCSIDSSVDAIQEERVGFSGITLKVEGACGRDNKNVVSVCVSR